MKKEAKYLVSVISVFFLIGLFAECVVMLNGKCPGRIFSAIYFTIIMTVFAFGLIAIYSIIKPKK